MAVFRQAASPNLDLEVDIGPASTYYNLFLTSPGATISVGGYNSTQFGTAFPGGTAGLDWAVMSAKPNSGTDGGPQPVRTVWLTDPRIDINTQTTPFTPSSPSTQSSWRSTILGIAGSGSIGGAAVWAAGTPANAVTNSPTAIIIPNSDNNSYTKIAGTLGNLGGTFGEGTIENSSPTSTAERSDLYELRPSSGSAIYLGHFDLATDGSMTFTAVPEPGSLPMMLGLGGAVLLLVHQRRRAAAR
jgi:hypothetical protein